MNLNEGLFIIASLLLSPHITYGGYFILSRLKKTDPLVNLFGFCVAISQIFMLLNVFYPPYWLLGVIISFIFAILFHTRIKTLLSRICLQEFCNYKIFIEAYGIILSVLGIITYFLLPWIIPALGILNILFILRLNWLIFFKKRLYSLDYPNPAELKTPLVSIVVIAYNEEDYIRESLEAIKKQTYPNFEVILVDDHSIDNTVKIAETFHKEFTLKIVQKEERGCSRSRNFGATHALGEIILFLDADAILPPDFLEKGLARFNTQKLSCAFFDFTPITDKKFDFIFTSIYRLWLKLVQYHNPRAIGSCIMVRKDLHQKLLFDTSVVMAEDFDYVRRAVEFGKFRIINNPKYHISWRRFEHENRLWLIAKYLIFEVYRQHIGEIRKPILKYRFGHYKRK
ncbi:glycosyltransferase family 2 protein [Candidatus Gracilibacteria bacterium]|nr:glycosyltransferase family 2 protein [Candidatus Gracilibacteria bacterium]